jgi:ATP-dependent Clp protease ATP-binding subunit ClpA
MASRFLRWLDKLLRFGVPTNWEKMSPPTQQIIFRAQELTKADGLNLVQNGHILRASVIESDLVQAVIGRLGIDAEAWSPYIDLEAESAKEPEDLTLSPKAKEAIDHIFAAGDHREPNSVHPEHLFVGCLRAASSEELDGQADRLTIPSVEEAIRTVKREQIFARGTVRPE